MRRDAGQQGVTYDHWNHRLDRHPALPRDIEALIRKVNLQTSFVSLDVEAFGGLGHNGAWI
jgi:hypothetical protein